MARRKKLSTTEYLFDRIALLPSWAGVLLTIGAYALLHSIATQALNAPSPPRMTDLDSSLTWPAIVGMAQYALPLVILVVTALSVWWRNRRGEQKGSGTQGGANDASQRSSKHPFDHLTIAQFETELAKAFQAQGYQIVENQRSGAGGRVDMVLRRDRETFLVLSKHWKDHRVAVDVVQQLQRIMTARGAMGGMVVTSGRFSREATAFASNCNIRLIDGAVLAGMIQGRSPTRVRAGVGAT